MVRSANTMTLSPSAASFPHEMASLLTPAPPSPPKTGLSVVIWIAATCGHASAPRSVYTLVAVIWMKSFGTPPPKKIAAVPGPGAMKRFIMASATS